VASPVLRDVAIGEVTRVHARYFFFLSARDIGERDANGGPGGPGKAARARQAGGSGEGHSLATLCWNQSDIFLLRQAVQWLCAIVRDGLFGGDEDSI